MIFHDKRYKNKIVTWYNTRQLTVTFAAMLHELGHEYLNHTHIYDGFDQKLESEIEAWDWAHAHWNQVPVRRRWPILYEEACLNSYAMHLDPFVTDYYYNIEREMIYDGQKIK